MDCDNRPKTKAVFGSAREQEVALHLGFRIRGNQAEVIDVNNHSITHARPADLFLKKAWDALMTPESEWGTASATPASG